MSQYYGDFSEDDTLYIPFNTFDSNDPSASVTITNLVAGDIHVHKDGGTTQLATDGATIAIDFDGVTGNHLITIDTSAHADYSTGSDYMVRIEGTTVDAATINAWVGSFSIENRYKHGVAQTVDNNVLAAGATGFAAIDTVVDTILSRVVGTLAAGTHNPASTAQLGALTDWIDGGRLDLILDIIAADTTTDIPALIATAQADLDTITGADGVNLLSATQASIDAIEVDTGTTLDTKLNTIDTNVDAVLVDTGATIPALIGTPAADVSADIAAVKVDTAAILVDTGTTLDAKIDTIDTVVDAIKVTTDKITFTVANQVDSNIQSINDVTITGDGSGTPFDV